MLYSRMPASNVGMDDLCDLFVLERHVENLREPFMKWNKISVFRKMTSLKDKLLCTVVEPVCSGRSKITVVGVGQVGMACAFSVLANVRAMQLQKYVQ